GELIRNAPPRGPRMEPPSELVRLTPPAAPSMGATSVDGRACRIEPLLRIPPVKRVTVLVPVVATALPSGASCVILPPVSVCMVIWEPVARDDSWTILPPALADPFGLAAVPDSRKKVPVGPITVTPVFVLVFV